jgi:ethanolamine utilization protein EutP (predicted NTPase)
MRIIEFDCDGVLFDMSTAVVNSKYGKKLRESNLTFEDSRTYNFSTFSEDIRKDIYTAFSDPEVIETLQAYPDAESMLSSLYLQIMNKPDIVISIRTGVTSRAVLEAKRDAINKLLDNSVGRFNPKFNVQIEVLADSDSIKNPLNPFICVEDFPTALEQSNARHKILMNHGYNNTQDIKYEYARVFNHNEMLNTIMNFVNSDID